MHAVCNIRDPELRNTSDPRGMWAAYRDQVARLVALSFGRDYEPRQPLVRPDREAA